MYILIYIYMYIYMYISVHLFSYTCQVLQFVWKNNFLVLRMVIAMLASSRPTSTMARVFFVVPFAWKQLSMKIGNNSMGLLWDCFDV